MGSYNATCCYLTHHQCTCIIPHAARCLLLVGSRRGGTGHWALGCSWCLSSCCLVFWPRRTASLLDSYLSRAYLPGLHYLKVTLEKPFPPLPSPSLPFSPLSSPSSTSSPNLAKPPLSSKLPHSSNVTDHHHHHHQCTTPARPRVGTQRQFHLYPPNQHTEPPQCRISDPRSKESCRCVTRTVHISITSPPVQWEGCPTRFVC